MQKVNIFAMLMDCAVALWINITSFVCLNQWFSTGVHVILVTRSPPISRWQERVKMIVLMSNSYEGVHQKKRREKGSMGKKRLRTTGLNGLVKQFTLII